MKRRISSRILLMIAVPVIVLLLAREFLPEGDAPDKAYTPYPIDGNASPYAQWPFPDDVPRVSANWYSVGLNPMPSLAPDNLLPIALLNPVANACYLMTDVRLGADNTLLYRTGMVSPGDGIRTIALSAKAAQMLRDNAAEGKTGIVYTVYSFSAKDYSSMGEITLLASVSIAYDHEEKEG